MVSVSRELWDIAPGILPQSIQKSYRLKGWFAGPAHSRTGAAQEWHWTRRMSKGGVCRCNVFSDISESVKHKSMSVLESGNVDSRTFHFQTRHLKITLQKTDGLTRRGTGNDEARSVLVALLDAVIWSHWTDICKKV